MRFLILFLGSLLFITASFGSSIAFGSSIDDAIKAAGITEPKTLDALKKYKRYKRNKAFYLNPINNMHYSYAQGYRSKSEAMKMAASYNRGYIPFFLNNSFVWPQEYEKYMATPIGMGRLLRHEEQYPEAIHKFKQAVAEDQTDWYGYYLLGWTYYDHGDMRMAVVTFDAYLAQKYNTKLLLSKADILLRLHEADKAQAALTLVKGKLSKGQRSQYKYLFALCHVARGEYKEAVKEIGGRSLLGIQFKLQDEGVEIVDLFQGGPAMLAGLKAGDVIVEYDGVSAKVAKTYEFTEMVSDSPYGTTSTALVLRDGIMYEVKVVNGITTDMIERTNRIKEQTPMTAVPNNTAP